MEVVIQLSLLTLSVCIGAAALLRRSSRSEVNVRIGVDPVSNSWLTDHKTRSRPE
jgi:hypothetical protein